MSITTRKRWNPFRINWKQIVRFLLNGGICAVSEFGLLFLLIEVITIHYLTSNLVAFLVINILNYFLNRKWVFQAGQHHPILEFSLFFITVIIALGINQFFMWFCVSILQMNYLYAKVVATVITVIWNFTSRKYVVFKQK